MPDMRKVPDMSETRLLTRHETARLLRGALTARFPGFWFSVRPRRVAGGAGLVVRWTDGPTRAEVETVVRLYAGSTFEPTSGTLRRHDSLLCQPGGELPQAVRFGADLILTARHLSRAARSAIGAQCERSLGERLDARRPAHRQIQHRARAVAAFDHDGWLCSTFGPPAPVPRDRVGTTARSSKVVRLISSAGGGTAVRGGTG